MRALLVLTKLPQFAAPIYCTKRRRHRAYTLLQKFERLKHRTHGDTTVTAPNLAEFPKKKLADLSPF